MTRGSQHVCALHVDAGGTVGDERGSQHVFAIQVDAIPEHCTSLSLASCDTSKDETELPDAVVSPSGQDAA